LIVLLSVLMFSKPAVAPLWIFLQPCLCHSPLNRPSACLAPVRTSTKGFPFQLMGRIVHTGLGSSSLVAHVLHYPPPPTRIAGNRYCVINTHTHTPLSKIPPSVKPLGFSPFIDLSQQMTLPPALLSSLSLFPLCLPPRLNRGQVHRKH
jgi:hypothetical protein